MTAAKLTDAESVLAWAIEANGGVDWRGNRTLPDRASAARIAKAMRLLECAEEMETMEGPFRNGGNARLAMEEGIADGWNACVNTLRAALKVSAE